MHHHIFIMLATVLGLSGCANSLSYQGMDNPSLVGVQKLQLASAPVTIAIKSNDVVHAIVPPPEKFIAIIADYQKRGRGAFELLLPNTKQKTLWLKTLQAAGLEASQIQIILTPDLPTPQIATLRYQGWQVLPPADCSQIATMPDADNFSFNTDPAYKFGCTRDQYLGAMVATPTDLLGRDTTTNTDSQRLSKGLDTYYKGERLTPSTAKPVSTGNVEGGS